ncbi:hypothetical protein BRC73_06680 [Halobacteriales archaeon QH_7_66_37]|nr:MAG: hypothetical protein BRC73_06680 [Halobacteriales archaeon QH_7_66_37]
MLGNASQERCPAGCSTGRRHRADEASDNSRADEQRSGNAEQVGPSGGLPEQVPDHVSEIHETIEPEQVPDHVSEIHETIESFLSGELDSLGDAPNAGFSVQLT